MWIKSNIKPNFLFRNKVTGVAVVNNNSSIQMCLGRCGVSFTWDLQTDSHVDGNNLRRFGGEKAPPCSFSFHAWSKLEAKIEFI